MSSFVRAATAVVVTMLVVGACGSRTTLDDANGPSARKSFDAGGPSDATADFAVDSGAREAGPDASSCASTGPGCARASCPCRKSDECCSLLCRDGVCAIPKPFVCGDVDCSDSNEQYCLATFGGSCVNLGGACTESIDCCTGFCGFGSGGATGICSVPGLDAGAFDGGGASGHYSCAALPDACRSSPPTCACVLARQPCGPDFGFAIDCTEIAGVVRVVCGGE